MGPRAPASPVAERPPAIGEIVAMLRPSKDVNAVLVQISRDPGQQELLVYDQDDGRLAGVLRRVDRRHDVLHCEVVRWGERRAMLRIGAPVYPSSEGDYPPVEYHEPPVMPDGALSPQ